MELTASQGGRQLITEEVVVFLLVQFFGVAWELFPKASLDVFLQPSPSIL